MPRGEEQLEDVTDDGEVETKPESIERRKARVIVTNISAVWE